MYIYVYLPTVNVENKEKNYTYENVNIYNGKSYVDSNVLLYKYLVYGYDYCGEVGEGTGANVVKYLASS